MPTHKKGHDKDKYYHLAKDQGFRSRAAFKLIQIDKRFDFLRKARVCIDLCAAPGGWCQVAAKHMPSGSIVLGVDLLPIRSLRGVKTVVADITTAECRKMIASEIQGWKADVVLCDGAPNIGSAYNKDAYVQNELVLAALKTATDHLVEGGTFCTKVYRSVDYNAIVWVLQQLFEDVQAMKPNSSRSQSSEIFLICLKYTAPDRIDPKLLDPNHVFKEIADPGLKKVDVLHKKHDKLNKRHRTGYEDSLGMTLRSTATVSDFISSSDPVRMLSDMNEFLFSESCHSFEVHPKTTPELIQCFKDLRVLGKIDFKKILKWRQLMRSDILGSKDVEVGSKDSVLVKPSLTEEERLEKEIQELKFAKGQLLRKEKKRDKVKAGKLREKQIASLVANAFEESGDVELFSTSGLGSLTSDDLVDKEFHVVDDNSDSDYEERNDRIVIMEDDLDQQLENDYSRYLSRKRMQQTEELVENSVPLDPNRRKIESHVEEEDSEGEEESNEHDIPTSILGSKSSNSAEGVWFSHPIFKESSIEKTVHLGRKGNEKASDDLLKIMPKTDREVRKEKRRKALERMQRRAARKASAFDAESELDHEGFEVTRSENCNDSDEVALSQEEIRRRELVRRGMGPKFNATLDSNPIEFVPGDEEFGIHDSRRYDSDHEEYDNHDLTTQLALGTLMLRPSRKRALIDSSYNRFAWNDDKDLPSWFVEDEMRHNKPEVPVPNALVQQIKSRFQLTGTKEIKKVAEARARKRKRALAKLKNAKKIANATAESSELSGREKLKAIARAMRSAKTDKASKIYVVTKKTGAGSVGTKSSNDKGKLKFVDKRMKKDARAMRAAKKRK